MSSRTCGIPVLIGTADAIRVIIREIRRNLQEQRHTHAQQHHRKEPRIIRHAGHTGDSGAGDDRSHRQWQRFRPGSTNPIRESHLSHTSSLLLCSDEIADQQAINYIRCGRTRQWCKPRKQHALCENPLTQRHLDERRLRQSARQTVTMRGFTHTVRARTRKSHAASPNTRRRARIHSHNGTLSCRTKRPQHPHAEFCEDRLTP